MDYDVKDLTLSPIGERNIRWARSHMPILRAIEERFIKEQPFAGKNIAISIHFEAKTAYLAQVLATGGAQVSITGSNVLSTQDSAAAALAQAGLRVFAHHGADEKTYVTHIDRVLDAKPDIIIDDGGDLVHRLHNERKELLPTLMGVCEETTTGVLRAQALEKAGLLQVPVVAVNSAYCKHLFDNRYGTGQTVWDAINSTTNLLVASKEVAIIGYGWCGKGIAMRAKGLGALVSVCEVDPVKALEAAMDGFKVAKFDQAARYADIIVTATGGINALDKGHFELMKDGVVLANAGHFGVEINVQALESLALERKEQRKNVVGYRLSNGHWISLIANAALVNIAAGDGHPAEIMDLSFSLQALSAEYVLKMAGTLENRVINVPREIDYLVARLKLSTMGYEIDSLSSAQQDYLLSWDG